MPNFEILLSWLNRNLSNNAAILFFLKVISSKCLNFKKAGVAKLVLLTLSGRYDYANRTLNLILNKLQNFFTREGKNSLKKFGDKHFEEFFTY